MYQQMIREVMARSGMIGAAEPRHVEAWMRTERGCLDSMSPRQFADAVRECVACARASDVSTNEGLCECEGL